jgi:membrane peptidoglycan carboxypeptidase
MLTLMAALEHGEIPADTIAGYYPCVIPDPNSVEKKWDPSNVEGQGGSVMSLTEATVQSVNCAYARLIKLVGPEKVVDVARRMGIKKADLQPLLSLTLGSIDVTPLEMATAYATLANDGEYREPYFIDRIEDRDGKVLYKSSVKSERAVSVHHARTATQTLTQVVQRGTGTAAAVPRWQVAGKTGSTDLNQDAWFVGVTPKLATAVWMGSPAGKVSMYNVGAFPRVYGGTYPAMIFNTFMRQFLAGQTPVDFAPPDRAANQRAPRHLDLQGCLLAQVQSNAPTQTPCGEITDGGVSPRQFASGPQGGGRTFSSDDDGPVNNSPRPPVSPSDPVAPQTPVITIPSFPDVTIPPRVVVPPPVVIDNFVPDDDDDDTTVTTRRPRAR